MAFVSLFNEEITGTTANSLPTTPQYQNERLGHDASKAVIVSNTDGSNALDYNIKVKDNLSSSYRTLASSTLVAGDTQETPITGNYAEIAVDLSSNVADSHATFSVSANSRGNRGT